MDIKWTHLWSNIQKTSLTPKLLRLLRGACLASAPKYQACAPVMKEHYQQPELEICDVPN